VGDPERDLTGEGVSGAAGHQQASRACLAGLTRSHMIVYQKGPRTRGTLATYRPIFPSVWSKYR
jgi:hypothetical protein